jgi:hypothetical protein
MLKRLTLALLFLFSFTTTYATHIEGGELRYEFNGTNYTVYVTLYSLCGNPGLQNTATVDFYAMSCNDSFSRVFTLTQIDTITDMWCPTVASGCGLGFNYIRAARYIDTVSLDQCTDWRITSIHGALNNAIDNLGPGPGGLDMCLIATLDNSLAINRSAVLANHPPFYVGMNDFYTSPFQPVDADGDSVDYQLEELHTAPTIIQPWGTGFSNANQLGGSTSFWNGNLYIYPTVTSENMMVIRVKEYRNAVLIGSYNRIWTTYVRPTLTEPTPPMPAPGTIFEYTTCAGQTENLNFTFDDSVATDSVFIDFMPPTMTGFTFTSSSTPQLGTASGTISWTTPTTNVTDFIIPVKVYDNHCPNVGYAYYSILVHVLQCNPDSVWAGDANADFTANMYDPLAIAVAYGQTGTVRPGATTTWQAEFCPNWPTQFTSGINHKHADCNGNGVINSSDLGAITANYGQVHLRPGAPAAKSAGVPDLYFDFTGLSFTPGSQVTIPLNLGTPSSLMNNFYGIATNIKVQGITLTSQAQYTYTNSWVGTLANTFSFTHYASNSDMDWVVAKNDHLNASGEGAFCAMILNIPAGTPDGTPIIFHFSGTRIIDNNGDEITAYNVIDDTVYVTATNVPGTENPSVEAVIVPNPSKNTAHMQITASSNEAVTIVVTDIAGRVIHKVQTNLAKGMQEITLPTVAPGMYEIRIQSQSFAGSKAMKWIQL